MPDFRKYGIKVDKPGTSRPRTRRPLGVFLRDVMKQNMTNFRVFGPDENTSNKLNAVYEVSKKLWLAEYFPEDADGGELAPDGRVIEMLSEHTLEGMLEGYLLTGRHGFFSTYESFVHVIDSMFNQHAKWLAICNHLSWRADDRLAEPAHHLDRLAAGPQRVHAPGSRVPRPGREQEPGGHAHLPAAGRELAACRSPTTACGASNYINVIVSDKQMHLQYLDMDEAIAHCTKGLGIWAKASNDQGERAGRGDGLRRRHPDQGSAGGDGHAAAGVSRT